MKTIICFKCGIEYAVSEIWVDNRKHDHETFWCPNGHQQRFLSESNAERFERERNMAKQELARVEEERDAERRKVKRLERRVSGGTCPCCTRTFANMARHMKTKHPEFIAQNVVKFK